MGRRELGPFGQSCRIYVAHVVGLSVWQMDGAAFYDKMGVLFSFLFIYKYVICFPFCVTSFSVLFSVVIITQISSTRICQINCGRIWRNDNVAYLQAFSIIYVCLPVKYYCSVNYGFIVTLNRKYGRFNTYLLKFSCLSTDIKWGNSLLQLSQCRCHVYAKCRI